MLIELNHMVQCLREMQASNCQDAHNKMVEICLNPAVFSNFRKILSDPNVQQPTKKMTAVFFKNYFSERYCDFDEVFFIQLIMSIVMDQKLCFKYKVLIQETIVSMLDWIQKENISQIIDCVQNAFFCLERASGKQIVCLEKVSIKKKTNLDPTRLDLSKLYKFNLKTQEQFFNLAYSVIHLVQCFSSTSNTQCQDLHRVVRISLSVSLTIFPVKNTEIHLRLQMIILHMWLGYLQFLGNQKQNRPDLQAIQQQIVQEQFLWAKILEIYHFSAFNFVGLQSQVSLLVCSPQEPQRKIINKMKNYACQINLKILKFESQVSQKFQILNKTISPHLFTTLIKTLSYFSINKDIIMKCNCEQFVNSLLSMFIFVCSQNPEIIDTNWSNLLHLIIFPLLTLSEEQFLQFDQQPYEFNRLAQDCCDKQNLGQIKTQAARFLQVICDRNRSYSEYVVQFCIIALQSHIMKNQAKIQNTTALLPLQAAFMILSVISYNLSTFLLQLQVIRKVFIDPNCLKLTEIQSSRIFLLLSYNFNEIFKNPVQGKTWIQQSLSGSMHETTKLAAFDFLYNIVDEYFEEQFLIQFSQKLNTEIQLKKVWDILNKLLNNHLHNVSQSTMVVLVQRILQRLSSQISKYNNRQIKSTANINSGLQLMRKILSNHKYTADKPKVLQEIWKIIPLYKTFKKIHLQDVVLKIINQFMNREEGKVDQIFQQMLPEILDQFKAQRYKTTAFYWIFNQFIFKQELQRLQQLKNVLIQAINQLNLDYQSNKRKVQSNLPLAHSLLLLQHLLMLHGQKLPIAQILQIYQISSRIIPEDINQPERLNLSPLIIGRALIVVTICHMIKKDQKNNQTQKMNSLKYLLMFHDQEGVFVGQNAQVIIKLLCKQLFRQSDIVSVTQMINIMVRILRPAPKQQGVFSSGSKPKKNPMKIRLIHKQNYQVILNKIKSPFDKHVTAQSQLRDSLTKMKQNNECLYKSIIFYLPQQIKQKLRDLLSTNSISNSDVGKDRRIVKIGGVKETDQSEPNSEQAQSALVTSKKRYVHFDQDQEEGQAYQQISQNQLILQGDKQQFDEGEQDKKNKMKRNKIFKKLKQNEPSTFNT